jgi:tetratricopeptide (TPR) repeat protein
MDDIEKLKEKVEKDPSSTLFVPLAEKYRQAGQLDEAIEVLKRGIEHQPGYMSGRVALGKIYLEKDMLPEAKAEFEQVVVSIPDNLFAQRKLADIYKELGDVDKAISQYEKVLELHPADEEMQSIIRELKGEGPVPDEEAPQEFEEAVPEEGKAGIPIEGEIGVPVEDTGVQLEGESAAQVESEAVVLLEEEPSAEIPIEGEIGVPVEDTGVQLEGESAALTESETAGLIEEEPSAGIPIGELVDTETLSDEEQVEEPSVPIMEEEVSEESMKEYESTLEELSKPEVAEAVPVEEVLPDLSEADLCIQNEDYLRAMDIYSAHLSKDPENTAVLQKVQEIKGLLKLLGRENEIFETRLQSFLDAAKSHRDEFLKNS